MRSENIPIDRGERTFIDRARRAQLVDCAAEAIAELGLPRTSLAEVARRAGVSKPTVLYHFTSRDELIDAVLTTTLAAGAEFLAAHTAAAESPPQELAAYIAANVEYIDRHRRDAAVLSTIAINHVDGDGRSRLRHDASVYGTALAPLQDILERGQRAGQFGRFDPRVTAMSIRAAIDAIGPQLTVMPGLDLEAYGNELVELFRRATGSEAS